MSEPPDKRAPVKVEPVAVEQASEPPVVARLVVEIRSDGTKTIARGAMEDVATGVKVGVEATGATPMELAATLARSMFQLPLVRSADRRLGSLRRRVKALLPRRKG